jgi:hypothetical protein
MIPSLPAADRRKNGNFGRTRHWSVTFSRFAVYPHLGMSDDEGKSVPADRHGCVEYVTDGVTLDDQPVRASSFAGSSEQEQRRHVVTLGGSVGL